MCGAWRQGFANRRCLVLFLCFLGLACFEFLGLALKWTVEVPFRHWAWLTRSIPDSGFVFSELYSQSSLVVHLEIELDVFRSSIVGYFNSSQGHLDHALRKLPRGRNRLDWPSRHGCRYHVLRLDLPEQQTGRPDPTSAA